MTLQSRFPFLIWLVVAMLVGACNPSQERTDRPTPEPFRTTTLTPERSPRVHAAEDRFGLDGPVADISYSGMWLDMGTRSWTMFDWEGNSFEFSMTGYGYEPPHTFHWGTHHPRIKAGEMLPQDGPDEAHLLVLVADWLNRNVYPEEIEFVEELLDAHMDFPVKGMNDCQMAAYGFTAMSTQGRFRLLKDRLNGRQD